MQFLSTFAIYAWLPVVFGIHLLFAAPRAAVVAYAVGWIVLPLGVVDLPGLPEVGKFTATSLGVLPCILIFGLSHFRRFRPGLLDIPILVLGFSPMATSLANGLGWLDGMSGCLKHFLEYGVPYLAGRVYLREQDDWEFFAYLITCCAILYSPLCLLEMRLSPRLHEIVYGIRGRPSFESNPAFSPLQWAPTVFMNSAFELTMLMVAGTLICFTRWRAGVRERVFWLTPLVAAFFLFFFVVLCKKWSGLGLCIVGISVILASEVSRSRIWLAALITCPVVYMICFSANICRLEGVSETIAQVSERRAQSLQFRIDNDKMLTEKAMQRPILGWGGWGRSRIYDEEGRDISVTDSAFGIFLGKFGLTGLVAVSLLYILPVTAFFLGCPPKTWLAAPTVYVLPFSILLALHSIDNLINAFPCALYPLSSGGVTSFAMFRMAIDPGIPFRECKDE